MSQASTFGMQPVSTDLALGSEWLEVHFGRGSYGIPLPQIREVVVPRVLTRVPRSQPSILGLMSLRGRLITVYDPCIVLAEVSDASPASLREHGSARQTARILLLRTLGDEIGLWATELRGVRRSGDMVFEPTSVLGTLERPHLLAVARHAGQPILLLKLEELLRALVRP